VLYELSHELALILENGLRNLQGEESPRPVPVLFCHPLDPLEHPRSSPGGGVEGGTVGVLYPVRIFPEPIYRQIGLSLESEGRQGTGKELLRKPGLWVRVRYAFLVSGGSMEDQLGAMEAALRTLNDHPLVSLKESPSSSGEPDLPAEHQGGLQGAGLLEGSLAVEDPAEGGVFPLRIVDDPEGWRDLGLSEHRLTLSFEVTVLLPSSRAERVERVLDRDVRLENGAKG
jgi:hypothetical protein